MEMDRNGSDCACLDSDNNSFSKILESTPFERVPLITLIPKGLTL